MQIEDGFHLFLTVEDIPVAGLDIEPVVANAIIPSLCERFLIDDLQNVSIKAHAARFDKEGFFLRGRMRADVLQACVVSLEPVWSHVEAHFEVEFQPEAHVAALDINPEDFETEIPEPIGAEGADIGDVIGQIFALEIPLYPKHPDAALDPNFASEMAEKEASPFAVLRNLEKK
jgi:uncharacterized metal-binding protein YceD (DUF177 family)